MGVDLITYRLILGHIFTEYPLTGWISTTTNQQPYRLGLCRDSYHRLHIDHGAYNQLVGYGGVYRGSAWTAKAIPSGNGRF